MDKVKFYSENDMACGWELDKVIERVNDQSVEKEWELEDVIEFYNISKYMQVNRFSEYIQEKTNIICTEFVKKIKAKMGKYLNTNKSIIMSKYDEINFIETVDFLEIIEKYGIYKSIPNSEFKRFLAKENIPVYMVLKHKRIVDYFDSLIKDKIMSDSYNAETILSKFLDKTELHLPPSLNEEEMLTLIDNYIEIDAERVHINVLRKIIHFPTGVGLNITDKIRLHATRKEKEESERIFSQGTGLESSVSVSYEKGLDEIMMLDTNGSASKVLIRISREWIEENKDYPTLWNNFIHLFGVIDSNARVAAVSKKNDSSTLASVFMQTGKHLYKTSFAFGFKEMTFNAQVYSYIQVLNAMNIRIEDMIEWFFKDYLKDEFTIDNFVVKMPSDVSTYFEKCRTALPEIDRIFKQYNALIEDGEIDHELIQISSSSVRAKEVKSYIQHKYLYPIGDWYQTAAFLLFSDQSSLFYIPEMKENYKNFLDLILRCNLKENDFQEYQLRKMSWLFENDIIHENEDGFIKIKDINMVFILKESYYEDVLNYFNYEPSLRNVIDMFVEKGVLTFETSLLTRNEQDYLDFYLNKSKFTNGYDIRNRYLHGTNVNDEKQYESDYYAILKLIIIIVLKINDDLCLNDIHERK